MWYWTEEPAGKIKGNGNDMKLFKKTPFLRQRINDSGDGGDIEQKNLHRKEKKNGNDTKLSNKYTNLNKNMINDTKGWSSVQNFGNPSVWDNQFMPWAIKMY